MGSLAIQTEDRLKQLHFTKDRISLDWMDGPTITLPLVSYPRRMRHPHSARSGNYAAVVRAFIEKKSIAISVAKECCADHPRRIRASEVERKVESSSQQIIRAIFIFLTHSQQSTVNSQQSTVNSQQSTVNSQP